MLALTFTLLAACGGSPRPAPEPTPGPDPTAPCFKGGCSGQVCSDREGVVSTCEFEPEYACYRSAECARHADGACGWTQTAELTECLQNPPAE
jgi:eight-cysteine-cluster-containing protein